MTRRPPCAPACPLITACQECDWQSLTPVPFIVGVSAGEAACREGDLVGESTRMSGITETAPAGNRGLTDDPIRAERRLAQW